MADPQDANSPQPQPQPHDDQNGAVVVRHFPKLSICMLMVQILIAILGYLGLYISESEAYGAPLAASGILGWSFSILTWIFTLPYGCRQWPFLVSTLILPITCFMGLLSGVIYSVDVFYDDTLIEFFLILMATTNIAWMIPFRLLMDALRDVIDAHNDSIDGLNGSSDTVVESMVPRFFGATIPLFYLVMNSISSFIKYSTADDADDAKEELAAAWSNYFLGIAAILTILAKEVWNASRITWKGLITLRITKMEAASFVLILLIIFAALVLESQVIPFTLRSMPIFFVAMTNLPPLVLGVLYLMCRRLLVEGGNTYYEERKQAINNNGAGNSNGLDIDGAEMLGLVDCPTSRGDVDSADAPHVAPGDGEGLDAQRTIDSASSCTIAFGIVHADGSVTDVYSSDRHSGANSHEHPNTDVDSPASTPAGRATLKRRKKKKRKKHRTDRQ